MSARHRIKPLPSAEPKRKRALPAYRVPALRLTESERLRLAHAIWETRTTLLLLAPVSAALRPRALAGAKVCIEVTETLWPLPPSDEEPER